MFLYLHVKFAYKSNKFIQNLNNIYKIVHLIFLVYFNIHIYYGDYSYSQEINYEVILLLLVITSIYTVILSYFISKKIMYLYICLSIITAFFAYSFTSIHGLYYLALVFLIYYGLIYYKHILLSFMLLFAVLIFNNLAKFLSILVLFSVFASDDKSTKCPLDFNLDMIRYSDSYIYKHVNEYKYTYGVEYQFKTYYTEAHYLYNYFLSMDVVREEKGYFRIRKEYVHSKDKTYDNYNGIKVKDWCK